MREHAHCPYRGVIEDETVLSVGCPNMEGLTWKSGQYCYGWVLSVPHRPSVEGLVTSLWCYWEMMEPVGGGA
jgi:hypothetical protein